MAAVGKVIYSLLSAYTKIGDIYPVEAPQDASLPYIVYSIVSSYPANTKDGGSAIDVYRVQLTVWGKRSDMDSIYQEIADIRNALDQKSGTLNNITYDKIIYDGGESETYSLDGDLMGVNVDYLVRIKL